MAKLNKDQIKYAVQRANEKLNEKLSNLQNSIPEVKDPRDDALKVYDALYSGERMTFPEFFKRFERGYYFANGIKELVENNVGFMNEFNNYIEMMSEIRTDIDKQRTAIQKHFLQGKLLAVKKVSNGTKPDGNHIQ